MGRILHPVLARFKNSLRAFPFSVEGSALGRQVQQYQDVETWESEYPFKRKTENGKRKTPVSVNPCGE